MKMISITGPESSGKTSFAKYCAAGLSNSLFVEEYARVYLEKNHPDGHFPKEVIAEMLREQIEIWKIAQTQQADFLICDGDIFIYKVWVKYVYNETWESIENFISSFRPQLVVLCRPDIPWQQDPLRSNPDDRDALFEMYLEEIEKNGIQYILLEGPLERRNETTLDLVTRALSINHPK